MKISRLEGFTICVTALAITFLAGWFSCRQYETSRLFSPSPVESTAAAEVSATPPAAPSGLVNINTAGMEELMTLPGIGEKRAAGIIAHREAHGPFPIPEAVTDVPGIGESTMTEIIDRITVED